MTRQNSPHSITGIGLLSAAGLGVAETRETFYNQHLPSLCDASEEHYLKFSHQPEWLKRFDLPEDFFTPNLFALLAIEEALNSAGLSRDSLRGKRVGVCLGSTAGCSNYHEGFADEYNRDGKPQPDALWAFFCTNSSQFISRYYGLRGPVMMVNNACTSGADAIGIAAGWLDADLCDIVICGGTESVILRVYYGFRSLMLCSPQACRPFDQRRNGLTLGEGAGIFLLEKNSSPRPALAHYLGYGSGSDAFHPTSPHPEARGLNLAVKVALNQAALSAAAIDFINVHGTGTPHNDLTEGRWIQQNIRQARVLATKGYTGHTLGAAGAIEAVLTVMALQDQKLPKSRGFEQFDADIGVAPTLDSERGNFSTALSFSLGFGGTNAVLCLGRA